MAVWARLLATLPSSPPAAVDTDRESMASTSDDDPPSSAFYTYENTAYLVSETEGSSTESSSAEGQRRCKCHPRAQPHKKPASALANLDTSHMISFKRMRQLNCANCTSVLDPVMLTPCHAAATSSSPVRASVETRQQAPLSCPPAETEPPSHRASRLNRFNLTINTTSTEGGHWCWSAEPVYALIANSPVVKKLREFGFSYPDESDFKRRRSLNITLICVLLTVGVLIFLNAVVPLVLRNSHKKPPQSVTALPFLADYEMINMELNEKQLKKAPEIPRTSGRTDNIPVQIITGGPAKHSEATPRPSVVNYTIRILGNSTQTPTPKGSSPSASYTTSRPNTSTTTAAFLAASTWLPTFSDDVVCDSNQFKCVNGASRIPCLYEWERCDGIQDCSDGSDEQFCDKLRCYGNFQCLNGQCVSLAKACNGITDCEDGSDEYVCDSFECQSYEFQCPSGYCIPTDWLCDGEVDCPDHDDEFNCSSSCSDDEFLCAEGWCIAKAWQCNGVSDCLNSEDEANCSCAEDHFKCSSTGGCLPRSQLCDGVPQCADGSDEWNCVVNEEKLRIYDTTTDSYLPVCSTFWNDQLAEKFCSHLGMSFDSSTSAALSRPIPADQDFVLTLSNPSNPITQFDFQSDFKRLHRSQCLSNSIVTLSCQQQSCGVWHPSKKRRKRVVGGHVSANHQWPSVALLYHPGKRWTCTASIVSPHWLITSALCVSRTDSDASSWRLIAGSSAPNESDAHAYTRPVGRLVRHTNYKLRTLLADADAMLVRVGEPFRLTAAAPPAAVVHHGAVCLPRAPLDHNSVCITAGWGYTVPGGFFINKQLRHLEMALVDTVTCNSSSHYDGLIAAHSLCAQSRQPQSQACFNDEGAPLMCYDAASGRWQLTGVLTAHTCGSRRHPSVFADVHSLQPWISHVITSDDGP